MTNPPIAPTGQLGWQRGIPPRIDGKSCGNSNAITENTIMQATRYVLLKNPVSKYASCLLTPSQINAAVGTAKNRDVKRLINRDSRKPP
jgi:hypothetical protein